MLKKQKRNEIVRPYLISTILLCLPLLAQDSNEPKAIDLQQFDRAHMVDAAPFFTQFHQGEVAGSMKLSTEFKDDKLIVSDTTIVPKFDIEETATAVLNAKSLDHESLTMTGHFSTFTVDVSLNYGPSRLKGYSIFPRSREDFGELEIDHELPKGAIARVVLFALVPALPFEKGSLFSVTMSKNDGSFVPIRIEVGELEQVEVRAGSFQARAVKLLGDSVEQAFYVTDETPRRTVKIDVINSPWRYELDNEVSKN